MRRRPAPRRSRPPPRSPLEHPAGAIKRTEGPLRYWVASLDEDRSALVPDDRTFRPRRCRRARRPLRPQSLASARQHLDPSVASGLFQLADAAALAAVFLLWPGAHGGWIRLLDLLAPCLIVVALGLAGAYRFPRAERLRAYLSLTLVAFVAAFAGARLLLPAMLGKAAPPFDPALAGTGLAAVAALHLGWYGLMARWRGKGLLTPNIVIVGATPIALDLILRLVNRPRRRRGQRHRHLRRPQARPQGHAGRAGAGPGRAAADPPRPGLRRPDRHHGPARRRAARGPAGRAAVRPASRDRPGGRPSGRRRHWPPRRPAPDAPARAAHRRPPRGGQAGAGHRPGRPGPAGRLARPCGRGLGREAGLPRPDLLPPEAARLQQRGVLRPQVPLDVGRRRRRHGLASGDRRRRPRHPRGPLHPQDQPRRAAPADQRAARRDVAGRPAAPRHRHEEQRRRRRQPDQQLQPSPSAQAGPHRPGRRARLARGRSTTWSPCSAG